MDCLSPLAVRRIINKDVMGSPTAVCSLYRELHEPSVTNTGGDLIERMERQHPTAGRSVEGSSDIDVERHSCSTTDQQARLAAMKEQLASIAAQPRVLTSAPAEADLVPAEADQGSTEEQLAPAKMQLVPAEADLVPAEADQGSAEEQLVPTQMQLVSARADLLPAEADLVPAEADLVPAEAPLVSTRTRPADTARKRTPSAVAEGPGPVLPSEQEAGVTAVCAEATRPVESEEALTSPQSRAGMPTAVGEEPREPQGAAPSPPRKRCNMAGGDGWRGQLF
jgi:hypothetical protein